MDKAEKSLLRKALATLTLVSAELLVVWILFLGAFIVFLMISRDIFILRENEVDDQFFLFLEQFVSPGVTVMMQFFSFLASKEFVFGAALLVIFYFMFVKKHKWYSIKVPVVAVGSITLNVVLKLFFNRPRPLLPRLADASGLSFPSGHAMVSFSFYGLLIYLIWINVENRILKWFLICFLFVLILMIGLSRVYLRVHYATDVLAGYALGIIWLVISIVVLNIMEQFSRNTIDPIVEE